MLRREEKNRRKAERKPAFELNMWVIYTINTFNILCSNWFTESGYLYRVTDGNDSPFSCLSEPFFYSRYALMAVIIKRIFCASLACVQESLEESIVSAIVHHT